MTKHLNIFVSISFFTFLVDVDIISSGEKGRNPCSDAFTIIVQYFGAGYKEHYFLFFNFFSNLMMCFFYF